MTSTAIFDKVASGEMTADEGTEKLIQKRTRKPPRQPEWMPRWMYVGLVLAVYVAFAPIISSSQRRS